MLKLRPNCECCDRDLPPDSAEARICSFECTFCARCAVEKLDGRCPNCGGELVARPRRAARAVASSRRAANKLANHPASTERIHNPAGCAKAA